MTMIVPKGNAFVVCSTTTKKREKIKQCKDKKRETEETGTGHMYGVRARGRREEEEKR
jgi:hypothetical protein